MEFWNYGKKSWKSHGIWQANIAYLQIAAAMRQLISFMFIMELFKQILNWNELAPLHSNISKSNWCVCRLRGHGILWYGRGKVMEFFRNNFVATLIQQSAKGWTSPAVSGYVSDSGEQLNMHMIVWEQVGCSQPQSAFPKCMFHDILDKPGLRTVP